MERASRPAHVDAGVSHRPPPGVAGRRPTSIRADIVAGVSVALVLIPQSIAYAQLAGMPPVTGLYAAAVPPLIAACCASSPYLQTGPTALTALLTFAALSGSALPGSSRWVASAAMLAIVVGVVRVAIGTLRAGAVMYLLSEPMLAGFARGAAVLIVAGQLPALLGAGGTTHGTVRDAWDALATSGRWSPGAALAAAAAAAIVVVARRVHVLIPGILVAAGAAVIAVHSGVDAGRLVGDVPAGFPRLSIPTGGLSSLLLPGIVIALVGFSESAAIARSFAVLERMPWNPSRDLVGQGLGNIAAGCVGAFPVGGSFTRSALNRMAGATSSRSGAVAALAVLAFLPLSGWVGDIPRSVLAAFIVLAASTLFRPREIVELWKLSRVQFGVAAATFAATLFLAPHVERAVAIGFAVTIVVHLWRETIVRTAVSSDGEVIEIKPSGVVWFANAQAVADAVASAVGRHGGARVVRLRLEGFGRIDLTAALTLSRLAEDLRASGIEVDISGVPAIAKPVFDRMVAHGAMRQPITTQETT